MPKYGALALGMCIGLAVAVAWDFVKPPAQNGNGINIEENIEEKDKSISATTSPEVNNISTTIARPLSDDEITAICTKWAANKEIGLESDSGPIESGVKKVALSPEQQKAYQQQQQQVLDLEAMNNYSAASTLYSPPPSTEQAASIEQQNISHTLSEGQEATSNHSHQDSIVQQEEQLKYQ